MYLSDRDECISAPSLISMRLQSGKFQVWAWAAYQPLRGRDAYVGARVEVIDGVIWGKDFFIITDASKGSGKDQADYALDASADTAWRSKYFNWWAGETHPDYSIGPPEAHVLVVRPHTRDSRPSQMRAFNET
jgi:hypothetical protein